MTLYHGNSRDLDEWRSAEVLVSDVPYGIDYRSNSRRVTLARSIEGDKDTVARDTAIKLFRESHQLGTEAPALIFGTWRIPRPEGTRQVLVWDTKGALGMGAMDLPWKPAHQEIYVLGKGFVGHRSSDVITAAPVQSMGKNGRVHPHQKPVALMEALIEKCPPGVIADPFAGSGSTLIAARNLGRKIIGVELEERYCEVIANRLGQGAFNFAALVEED
ncbi:site-specific DNA-methyltransferase [Leucobacter allii]|uniref:site-specific DNA-methyltransferase n=1 Tax=Leucobacter allii TaxID=2932247 RepID=UPI001FD1EB0F|nr:site-specific DNA-methyltransferase [Leucobacter allii]UOR02040.1 site-specific DNA-methyltransferase [Leucobacter allii]